MPPPHLLKIDLVNSAATLKISARPPKPNQVFIVPQCYIHANLSQVHLPVHTKYCKQDADFNADRMHMSNNVPLPFDEGT